VRLTPGPPRPIGGQGKLILPLPGPLGHANRPLYRQHSASDWRYIVAVHKSSEEGSLDLQIGSIVIHDFAYWRHRYAGIPVYIRAVNHF
jgi:hypothetical protein